MLGKRLPRADAEAKVRGLAVYGIDYEESRMLHAKILRSPVPAGRIVKLNVARALELPGVHAAITADDTVNRVGAVVMDMPLMAEGEVRYLGEPIAALAAETLEQAEAALAMIDLQIEPHEAVTDLEQALARDARLVHPNWLSYEVDDAGVKGARGGNIVWEARLDRGDVDAEFERADLIVEDEYRVPRHHQCYIEPRCGVARYENGRYIIHTSTQIPYNVRNTTARFLGVRETDVRVIATAVGGGFGGKTDAYLEPFCALLAKKTGRPVKLVNTREEEFTTGNPRENAIIRMRSAVSRDGEILARDAEMLLDAGAYSGEQPILTGIPSLMLPSVYRVRTARVVNKLIYTNTAPTGAFRGVEGAFAFFALERHMDQIAKKLGVDRREFRLHNIYVDGDRGPTGQLLPDVAFVEAFEKIERIARWVEISSKRPYHGVGLAAVMWMTTGGSSSAMLKLNEDGTVGLITAGTEIGSGAVVAGVRQLVAEELSVSPDDVVILPPDTDAAPFDMGAMGSRITFNVGNALGRAAKEVREQISEAASEQLEVAPGDLELSGGRVQVVGAPDRSVTLEKIAQRVLLTKGPIIGKGRYMTDPIETIQGCLRGNFVDAFNAPTFHVHLAEVEVDPETGIVTIVRYVVAQDVGRAINPTAIEGQIQGGVLQGIGYALYEQQRLKDGIYLDKSFETYRVPTALDAPPIDIILLEHPAPNGPFGAKGVGEPTILPVAGAIANAVSDAIGHDFNELPITPFAVLEALGRKPGVRYGGR
jgi:CO/xanthine dehydrogenase Mo-binding subunit